jgi:hypothetical protein
MRNMKWLIAAILAIPAGGCVQSMDQSYGYSDGYYSNGYANSGYYGSPGYYATPSVSNYYYTPAPTVVTQTRYVPVPAPVPVPTRQVDRDDHRWWGHRDSPQPQQPPQHVDRPHGPPPQASNPQPNNNGGNTNRHNGNWRDRNGDGQPDRRS